ncbi:MAG: DNA repair protein RecN [Clostridia bacterium]|nr:DNA repair protein RecN [Clostridia bacterium]
MLRSLQIRNIAVIKSADIELGDAFTVLTGETGAGKSIIIDSISLLLGSRAPRELIRSGESRATVTALFEGVGAGTLELLESYGVVCEDGSVLLSRTVSSDGRSTAHANGQSVTQAMLREIGRTLITIHGQHDNQRLMQKAYHIRLLDAYAGLDGRLAEYREVYERLRSQRSELEALKRDEAEKIRLRDILEYQIKEIDAARLRAGEEEELSTERLRLQSIEKIKKQTDFAYRALHGSDKGSVTLLLDRAGAALSQISGVIPEAAELAERLASCRYEVEDIAMTARGFADDTDGDPTARLDKIESRLDTISRLERKYGSDIAAVRAFRDDAAARLDALDNIDARADELEDSIKKLEAQARALAEKLTERRAMCAKEAAARVCDTLSYLDMPGVKFEIAVRATELCADGADEVEFMIAANPGEPAVPLAKTASGGELSRVMLALKCVLSENDGIDTMIFDEVDAGISGKTSRKVGVKLSELSRSAQVLCVTHSAQIASLADDHLLISKSEVDGRAETGVRAIEGEARVDEIARILGGINITETQRDAARELMKHE